MLESEKKLWANERAQLVAMVTRSDTSIVDLETRLKNVQRERDVALSDVARLQESLRQCHSKDSAMIYMNAEIERLLTENRRLKRSEEECAGAVLEGETLGEYIKRLKNERDAENTESSRVSKMLDNVRGDVMRLQNECETSMSDLMRELKDARRMYRCVCVYMYI